MSAKRIKKNTKTKEIKRKICALVFEDKNKVYVDKTCSEDFWRYYDNHYRERISMTKEAFQECKSHNSLPGLYLLDEIIGTDAQAFTRCIAWSKHFSESGYELVGNKMSEFIAEMDEETMTIYQSIKAISIDEICAQQNNLLPNFKKIGKPKRTNLSKLDADEFRVEVIVKEKEYQKYKKTADEYGVPMSEYILDCVRLGGKFEVDTSFMEQYIKVIDGCYNLLSGMLSTYLLSKEYYPADIVKMEEIAKQIANSNGAVKEELIRLNRQLKRMKDGTQLNADQLL